MVYIIGHKSPDTDSVVSAIAYAFLKGNGYEPLIAEKLNAESLFVLNKFNFKIPKIYNKTIDGKFILVDHNEESQRVDNLDSDKIVEIIDHHKIDFKNNKPIKTLIKPYGSTSSIITEEFFIIKKKITKNLAGILLSAILSDTIIFNSPTTTEKDRELAQKLAKIAEIDDVFNFGMQLFNKKAEVVSKSAKEIIKNDFKDFIFGNKKIGIGQVELVDLIEINKKKDEIIIEMDDMVKKGDYFSTILMVTDIINKGSYFWIKGNKKTILETFKIKDGDFLSGFLSRKKQVVPMLFNIKQ